ncbi:hypothetical protein NDU88_001983 [Pleurodeles waltl]|uniref:Uncharacterized protein n=1 Tax=Pleurodeles waltl TaxID=8319 RepID=A0AAV7Q8L7_PLEWA|nr:hypothetical protein NDU88_001983 [Pleurodeles waltl]
MSAGCCGAQGPAMAGPTSLRPPGKGSRALWRRVTSPVFSGSRARQPRCHDLAPSPAPGLPSSSHRRALRAGPPTPMWTGPLHTLFSPLPAVRRICCGPPPTSAPVSGSRPGAQQGGPGKAPPLFGRTARPGRGALSGRHLGKSFLPHRFLEPARAGAQIGHYPVFSSIWRQSEGSPHPPLQYWLFWGDSGYCNPEGEEREAGASQRSCNRHSAIGHARAGKVFAAAVSGDLVTIEGF